MASAVPNSQAANTRQRAANKETVRRMVVASGLVGLKRIDVCRKTGLSRPTVQKYLVELRRDGKVDRSHPAGIKTRWGRVGIAEAYKASRDAYAAKAEQDRARYIEAKTAAEWADVWSERDPVRVLVSANEAPPIRPAGPSSVFNLGAAA